MILRQPSLRIIALALTLSFGISVAQNDRSYDTSDWIPIAKPCADCKPEATAVEKRATGRVLNLSEPPPNRFFPEDTNQQQYLKETTTPLRQQQQQYLKETAQPVLQQQQQYLKETAQQQQQYLKETAQQQQINNDQYKPAQNVEISQAQLQQYYVTQGPLNSYPQHLLKQHQYLLQQPQYLPRNNSNAYNPLGIGVQAINHELLGGRDHAYKQIDITSTTPKPEKQQQNVQLLYVPVEQLQHPKPNYDQHKQQQLVSIEKDFIQQALEAHKLQQQFQAYPSYTLPVYTTLPPTTLKPVSRKRRPHQPPLAVYMNGNKDAEVFDVLNVLKNAKSIEVHDAAGPNSPEIFVGPASLDPPNGYAKFDLPYLSNLDSNRVERKVDQLPFFVAPQNYKAPPGYSKISLPSPHVGSVVVAHREEPKEEPQQQRFTVILDDDSRQHFAQHDILTTTAIPTPPPPPPNKQNPYEISSNHFGQNVFTPNYHQETTTQYYVRRHPTRSKARQQQEQHKTKAPTQTPVTNLQNAYAEIHNVPKINTEPPAVYTEIDQENLQRHKQQTSFYPQFESTSLPKIKNYYAEPERVSSTPVSLNTGEDIFSIIPQVPSSNVQQKENSFDLSAQFLPSPNDYHKFEQFYQNTFLPNPNLNQVENSYASDQSKPTEQAPTGQGDDKYTVLEEFSINTKPTTSKYLETTSLKPVVEDQDDYRAPQINPVLPGLINDLQDPSVRQLLAPALLAPTTTTTEKSAQNYHNQHPTSPQDYEYNYQLLTTTETPPPSTEVVTTTERKRTRGRGNSRFNLRTTTSSTPRRQPQRTHRTQHPSRVRHRQETTTTTQNSLISETFTEKLATRQRFRTRGRPLKNEDNSQNTYTSPQAPSELPPTNPVHVHFQQPQFVAKSKVLSPEEEYLIKKYNLAYSVAGEANQSPKVVIQQQQEEAEVTTYAPPLAPVYISPAPVSHRTTTEQPRIRGRFRSKSRLTLTTTPTTTTTTTTTTTAPKSQAEEFYGFFRQPSYAPEQTNYGVTEQPSYREPLYSPSYVSSTVHSPLNQDIIVYSDSQNRQHDSVQFVGEIRPKFHSTTSQEPPTTKYYVATTTTTAAPSKKRIRGRIRIPPKRTNSVETTTQRQFLNEVQTDYEEITTRRNIPPQRVPTRRKSHFQLPGELIKTNDEDVEGGNYPRPFTKSTSTEKQFFQIAIDPSYEEDQVPYASIQRPKIIIPNGIPFDVKTTTMATNFDDEDEVTSLELQATTSSTIDEAMNKKRKRGYWKLVKHKPVDVFETAESQNVGVVSSNSVSDVEETSTDFFDSIYQMFGLNVENNATETTEAVVSTLPEEIFETTTTPTEVETRSAVIPNNVIAVKTSTSTEISQETEICYKGVCVKSKDGERRRG